MSQLWASLHLRACLCPRFGSVGLPFVPGDNTAPQCPQVMSLFPAGRPVEEALHQIALIFVATRGVEAGPVAVLAQVVE